MGYIFWTVCIYFYVWPFSPYLEHMEPGTSLCNESGICHVIVPYAKVKICEQCKNLVILNSLISFFFGKHYLTLADKNDSK